MIFSRQLGLLMLSVALLAACNDSTTVVSLPEVTSRHADSAQLHTPTSGDQLQQIPAWGAYQQRVEQALTMNPPVLSLDATELPEPKAQQAQTLALAHPGLQRYTRAQGSGEPLRNEIMNVRPALPADFGTTSMGPCQQAECYRVEMYSHFDNSSTIAFVDVQQQKVLGLSHQKYSQPDLPQRLIALAHALADASPQVKAILADQAGKKSPTKGEFKSALRDSRCERSHHLCVAPTYVFEQDALWAVVDLTDGQVVGTRWTALGESGPPVMVSERSLENESTFRNYCQRVNTLQQGGWVMDYVITGSDGLQVSNVRYQDKTVLKSAKLMDWHVSYSSRDNFGYSDAVGCPLFSSAVVVAYDGPKIEPIMRDGQQQGFALVQDFRQAPWPTPCNYRYEQRYEFYHDGRFRVAQADLGRGCGTDGMYRPVVRIDLDAGEMGEGDTLAEWTGRGWQVWDKEQWRLQDNGKLTAEGYQYRITGQDGRGFYLEPGRGQFGDGGRGDNAFTYVSVHRTGEGEQDTVTMGSCCNSDYQQGPDKFIEPSEPLQGQDLVLWYVPQIKNDGNPGSEYCWADTRVRNGVQDIQVWPCYSGPMFVPVKP